MKTKIKQALLMIVCMTMSLIMPNSIHASEGSVDVSAERPSSYIISIPKALTLSYDASIDKDKVMSDIYLYGDFSGNQEVSISFSKVFSLSQNGKSPVNMDVSVYGTGDYQSAISTGDETNWLYTVHSNDLVAADSKVNAKHVYFQAVSEDKLTAGTWDGNLALKINAKTLPTFAYVDGTKIMLNGQEFIIQGINVDLDYNHILYGRPLGYAEDSFKDIADIGFNTVRYMTSYDLYKWEFNWETTDNFIKWAENNNLKVIIDMHGTQGGRQLEFKEAAKDFWTTESLQLEYIEAWKDIAERYKDNSTVIMYDLLNEPVVFSDNDVDALYLNLMNKTINEIRQIDKNHIIDVEAYQAMTVTDQTIVATNPDWSKLVDPSSNFVVDNHFYGPTSICFSSKDNKYTYNNYKVYDDEVKMGKTDYMTENISTVGEWVEFNVGKVSKGYTADMNSNPNYATPIVQFAKPSTEGTVIYIDDIRVYEYDGNGILLGEVYRQSFSESDVTKWSLSLEGIAAVECDYTHGADDIGGCLRVEYLQDNVEFVWLANNKATNRFFSYDKEHTYAVTCKVKTNKTLPERALRTYLQTYNCAFAGNLSEYSKYIANNYKQNSINNNLPFICTEFGINNYAMDLGYMKYVIDMLTEMKSQHVNMCLFSYNGKDLGLLQDKSTGYETGESKIRQVNWDLLYNYFHNSTYSHVFKNYDVMKAYDCEYGQYVYVLSDYKTYKITDEVTTLQLNNGLYAKEVH